MRNILWLGVAFLLVASSAACSGATVGEQTDGALSTRERATELPPSGVPASGAQQDGAEPEGPVVLNEVVAGGDDSVELLNRSDAAVDLSGWRVTDSDPSHVTELAAGTILGPGERLLLVGVGQLAFGLGDDDAVYLFDGTGAEADVADWPAGAADTSYCRLPDGEGALVPCDAATPGEPN